MVIDPVCQPTTTLDWNFGQNLQMFFFCLLLFIAVESWFYMLMVLAILPRPASVIHFFSSLASVSISVSFALSWTFFEERSSNSSSTVFCSPFFFSRYLKAALLFWAFFLSRFSTG